MTRPLSPPPTPTRLLRRPSCIDRFEGSFYDRLQRCSFGTTSRLRTRLCARFSVERIPAIVSDGGAAPVPLCRVLARFQCRGTLRRPALRQKVQLRRTGESRLHRCLHSHPPCCRCHHMPGRLGLVCALDHGAFLTRRDEDCAKSSVSYPCCRHLAELFMHYLSRLRWSRPVSTLTHIGEQSLVILGLIGRHITRREAFLHDTEALAQSWSQEAACKE
ncbi:hypothetical protein C8F01DRAFT_1162700 [Mycena amicta]|nr:hypothetical protein C8F01DRAFT_1162700 [Mycena amicta]